MKERRIRMVILNTIFVIALIFFSSLMNYGTMDMTADMGAATIPGISFSLGNRKVNLLAGHKTPMHIPSMRDTVITVGNDGQLELNMEEYESDAKTLSYEIYTLDGETKLSEGTLQEVSNVMKLPVGNVFEEQEECVLVIKLELEQGPVYYYTRICGEKNNDLEACVEYVSALHDAMFQKNDEDLVLSKFEPNAEGDNSTLQHVTIHSDVAHAMWGELQPELVGDIRYEVKETKEAYTSVLLNYRVKCAGDNKKEKLFDVKEFFRIRLAEDTYYLLTYDRSMEELFPGEQAVLTSRGINLGVVSESLPYKVNKDGTVVSFVQGNELWSYNKSDSELALVFSFADSEKEDVRNRNDNHAIRILSAEENGNITFAVYGYMNRGIHEGESGVAIYYFKMGQNAVEEKAFIPSTQSLVEIQDELGKMAFYNDETNVLYVMLEGMLQRHNLESGESEIMLDGLSEGQYVASEDGRHLAYQIDEHGSGVEIIDFVTDTKRSIPAQDGEAVLPLGFIFDDFVYGFSKDTDKGIAFSGEEIQAIYQLEIRDVENQVVKTYQVNDTFITDVSIDANMITLKRAIKNGNMYSPISEDYITNNEETGAAVTCKTYWTELFQTQFRLEFEKGISDKKTKVLKPKFVLYEEDKTIASGNEQIASYFRVYGFGEYVGRYANAGDAIQKAKSVSGVVISPGERFVWEDGNRVAWYRNFYVKGFAANGMSTLSACVKAVLRYEDVSADVPAEMTMKEAMDFLQNCEIGEIIRFSDCTPKDMFYLVDKGIPVIAMTGSSNAILMIGYDAKTVTYVDPNSGAIRNATIEAVHQMIESSSHTYIGYVK